MSILNIKDVDKRLFSLGFEYLYAKKDDTSQKAIAKEAGVNQSDISNIRRGVEEGYPSLKKRHKIASVFGLTMYDVAEIGSKIDKNPAGCTEIPIFDDLIEKPLNPGLKEPFEGFVEVLKLPIKARGVRIVELVAERLGFENIHVAHGDRSRSDAFFEPLKRFFEGETTEEELYKESLDFFDTLKQKAEEALKQHGLK